MLGKESTRKPWTTITLAESPTGTLVTFEFSFDSVLIANEEMLRWGMGLMSFLCSCVTSQTLPNMPVGTVGAEPAPST